MNLPRASGEPVGAGTIRRCPEDFFVDEELGFAPDGSGEHLLLQVEKTGANTAWVAGALARCAGVAPRAVGYAGRKDRHAVTRQWFSIWLPGRATPDWNTWQIEGVAIRQAARHGRKLRRGALLGNRFRIAVRDLSVAGDLAQRLGALQRHGVPNYFGTQRFGRDGANLELARRLFAGAARPRRNRRSLALSAARSAVFNAVLARRVADGNWLTPLRGDALNLTGRGGFFVCDEPDDEIVGRIGRGELQPTGPLWGAGASPARHAAAALEADVMAAWATYADGLAASGLDQARRPLRVMPADLRWDRDDTGMTLAFTLPRGAFATTVLDEILEITDAAATVPANA